MSNKWTVKTFTPPRPQPTQVAQVDLTISELKLLLDGLSELAKPDVTQPLKTVLTEAADALFNAEPPTPVVYRGTDNAPTYQG